MEVSEVVVSGFTGKGVVETKDLAGIKNIVIEKDGMNES